MYAECMYGLQRYTLARVLTFTVLAIKQILYMLYLLPSPLESGPEIASSIT